MDQNKSEASLLQKMAAATSLEEQKKYASELEDLRQARRRHAQAEADSMWADKHLETYSPEGSVLANRSPLSHGTDWLADIDVPEHSVTEVETRMRAEASAWWSRVPDFVKEDPHEVGVQAAGLARRTASQYGTAAEKGVIAFYEQIRHLAEVGNHPKPHVPGENVGKDTETSASDTPSLAEGTEPEGDGTADAPVGASEVQNLDAATWPAQTEQEWKDGQEYPGKRATRKRASLDPSGLKEGDVVTITGGPSPITGPLVKDEDGNLGVEGPGEGEWTGVVAYRDGKASWNAVRADQVSKSASRKTAARKITVFEPCEAHRGWFSGDSRRRMAETWVEGGPGMGPACSPDFCKIKPGTDFYNEFSLEEVETISASWGVNKERTGSRKTAAGEKVVALVYGRETKEVYDRTFTDRYAALRKAAGFQFRGEEYFVGAVGKNGSPKTAQNCQNCGREVMNQEAYVTAWSDGATQKVLCRPCGDDVERGVVASRKSKEANWTPTPTTSTSLTVSPPHGPQAITRQIAQAVMGVGPDDVLELSVNGARYIVTRYSTGATTDFGSPDRQGRQSGDFTVYYPNGKSKEFYFGPSDPGGRSAAEDAANSIARNARYFTTSRKTAAQDHEIKAWLNESEWTADQITDLVKIIKGLGTDDEDAWVRAVQEYDSKKTSSRKQAANEDQPCASCGRPVGYLEVFPNDNGPGILCLDCYAESPMGRRMPTADELVQMWGGPVRQGSRKKSASRKTATHDHEAKPASKEAHRKAAARKVAAQFNTFEELEEHVRGLMAQWPGLVAAADMAYEAGDAEWFRAQPVEVLQDLWDIAASGFFVPWDDEVHDALLLHPGGFDKVMATRKTASTWVNVAFMDGDEGREVVDMIEDQGTQAAAEYLAQWDYGEDDNVTSGTPWGSSDYTEEVTAGGTQYTLAWNPGLGYASLQRKVGRTASRKTATHDHESSRKTSRIRWRPLDPGNPLDAMMMSPGYDGLYQALVGGNVLITVGESPDGGAFYSLSGAESGYISGFDSISDAMAAAQAAYGGTTASRKRATSALKDLASKIQVGAQDAPALRAMASLKSVDDTVRGLTGKQIIAHVLATGQMDEQTRQALTRVASRKTAIAQSGNQS